VAEDIAQIEAHRPALTGHCYRMLGSAVDADDAVQETFIRAWRSLDRFEERASLRTWLYRIATNVCLDELADRRRFRPMEEGAPSNAAGPSLTQLPQGHWIEPIPDHLALPSDANPAQSAILRQSIRLAFVAALQHLAPKQRAVLLLMEVLEWSAAEVAETLETSVPAVNSALQRARAAMAERRTGNPGELSQPQVRMLNRYVDAFERYDVDGLTSLLTEDAAMSMPPYQMWLQGPEAVSIWLNGIGSGCRGSRLLPTAACGSPAFGQYRRNPEGGHFPWALVVLELSGERISGWNSFLDTATLFPRFGLPLALPK
jgi:RNA polymerase sigma-70 factor (ECF subfamily)